MRGHISKRGSTYSVVLDVGRDPVTKKRKQKRISGFATKKEAEAALAKLIAEVERGTFFDPGKLTVGEWLQEWLKGHCTGDLSPTTIRGYRMMVEKHLIPAIGDIPLAKLQPVHLKNYYAQARESGRVDGRPSKGTRLSARTVLHHHRVLHKALHEAEKLGLISRNPADLVDPPRAEKKVPVTLTVEEAERSLEVLRGTYLYIPSLLAIATGARRGEILGLRWKDVDLDARAVTIEQELLRVERQYIFRQPKTTGSVRPIPIPPFVAEELKAHQLQQKKWRLAAGSAWQDTGLVCTSEDGSPINPDTLSPRFVKIMQRAGFPHITFHGLRHTHATLLLKWNVHPKKVSERLGHSSIKLTMDTYSHVMPTMQDEAVELLEKNLFSGARKKATNTAE